MGDSINRVMVAGGGTRNPHWLQIKADVSGWTLQVAPVAEASLLGAAHLAALAVREVWQSVGEQGAERFQPDPARHVVYRHLWEWGYRPLQQPLRASATVWAGF